MCRRIAQQVRSARLVRLKLTASIMAALWIVLDVKSFVAVRWACRVSKRGVDDLLKYAEEDLYDESEHWHPREGQTWRCEFKKLPLTINFNNPCPIGG